jgi:hypothetical protein
MQSMFNQVFVTGVATPRQRREAGAVWVASSCHQVWTESRPELCGWRWWRGDSPRPVIQGPAGCTLHCDSGDVRAPDSNLGLPCAVCRVPYLSPNSCHRRDPSHKNLIERGLHVFKLNTNNSIFGKNKVISIFLGGVPTKGPLLELSAVYLHWGRRGVKRRRDGVRTVCVRVCQCVR